MNKNFWKNKKVLITGHTGFKGRWTSLLLEYLGADVYGVSIKSNSKKVYYSLIKKNYFCDICDTSRISNIIKKIQPEIIFHFAAQSLVLSGYNKIIETYKTNFMGSINIIEAAKITKSVKCLLIATTDKVYKNNGKNISFHENSELGGKDPYSASKAALEIAIQSFISSELTNDMRIASVRAGNVIGGGDFGKDRLMTDLIEHFIGNKKQLIIRNPSSIRPWQYVLDVVNGYITLSEKLFKNKKYTGSYNFGPNKKLKKIKVKELVNALQLFFKDKQILISQGKKTIIRKEEKTIFLKTSKIKKFLNYKYKIFKLQDLLNRTLSVYKLIHKNKFRNIKKIYLSEIKDYLNL